MPRVSVWAGVLVSLATCFAVVFLVDETQKKQQHNALTDFTGNLTSNPPQNRAAARQLNIPEAVNPTKTGKRKRKDRTASTSARRKKSRQAEVAAEEAAPHHVHRNVSDAAATTSWFGWGDRKARLEDGSVVQVPGRLLATIEATRKSHCERVEQFEREVRVLQRVEKGRTKTAAEHMHFSQQHEKTTYPGGFSPFLATYTCPDEERVGAPLDGGKWICGARRLPKKNCVIYSIGSNGQDDFEIAMYRVAPHCETHTFDPGDFGSVINTTVTTYHQYMLTGITDRAQKMVTINDVMTELGHDHIDVFKIDIEGSEYDVLPLIFGKDRLKDVRIGQMQIEIHGRWTISPQKLRGLFRDLFDAGLEIFHTEINLIYPPAIEVAFINRTDIPIELRRGCDRNIVVPPDEKTPKPVTLLRRGK